MFCCYSNSEDKESNLLLDDVYDILTAVSATAEGRTAMCAKFTVSALCQALTKHCYGMFTVSFAYLLLIAFLSVICWL